MFRIPNSDGVDCWILKDYVAFIKKKKIIFHSIHLEIKLSWHLSTSCSSLLIVKCKANKPYVQANLYLTRSQKIKIDVIFNFYFTLIHHIN